MSGADGSCCLGTYTCVATNCMGNVTSSAALLGQITNKKESVNKKYRERGSLGERETIIYFQIDLKVETNFYV